MPMVSVLVKPASGNCNMHCDYCFYCDEQAKRKTASYGMMSLQTLKNVIKRTLMRSEYGYSIAFQGGEPTLCGLDFFREAVKYLNKYNKNHCRITIALQTNGSTLDEEWCQFLAENHILTGISVDGLPEIHDRYRHLNAGGSSYARVLKTTELLDRYGAEYNILTVIHKDTAHAIKDIYRAYRKRGWDFMQFITCLDPLNQPRGSMPWSLSPQDYGQFLIDLFDLWYEEIRAWRRPLPYIRQFENYVGIINGRAPESCEQVGHCGISYIVEADGSVFPCDFYALDEYKLGNFNTDLLPALDEKRRELSFVERSYNQPRECLSCRWFSLCRGACFRNRFTALDDTAGAGPLGLNYFCPGYKMFFEACHEKLLDAAEIFREHENDLF